MGHLEGSDSLLVVKEFLNFQEAKSSNWETSFPPLFASLFVFKKMQKLHLSVCEWSD